MSSDSSKAELVSITTESLHSLGTQSVNSVTSLINSLTQWSFPVEKYRAAYMYLPSGLACWDQTTLAPSTELFHKQWKKNPLPTRNAEESRYLLTNTHLSNKDPLRCNACSSISKTGGMIQGRDIRWSTSKDTHVAADSSTLQLRASINCLQWVAAPGSALSESSPFWVALYLQSSQWIRISHYRLGALKLFSLHLGNLEKQS